jgi:uncharacterized protein (TIGR02246 family)
MAVTGDARIPAAGRFGDKPNLKHREEKMTMQQKDTADPQTAQEIRAFTMTYDERFNKNDAASIAALFTEDAVQVAPEGLIFGRQAIEKKYADLFQHWHPTNIISKVDQVNAVGNHAWKVGEWSCTMQTQNGPLPEKGYFASICVREGDAWKECMSAYNMAPPPETT